MSAISDSDLRAMRTRCEAARAEEWYVEEDTYILGQLTGNNSITVIPIGTIEHKDDAVFTAHARTDLPRCLDEIERLRSLVIQGNHCLNEGAELVQDYHTECIAQREEITRLRRVVEAVRKDADMCLHLPRSNEDSICAGCCEIREAIAALPRST